MGECVRALNLLEELNLGLCEPVEKSSKGSRIVMGQGFDWKQFKVSGNKKEAYFLSRTGWTFRMPPLQGIVLGGRRPLPRLHFPPTLRYALWDYFDGFGAFLGRCRVRRMDVPDRTGSIPPNIIPNASVERREMAMGRQH